MRMPAITLLQWQKRFATEYACAQFLLKLRWPNGFQCPACGARKAYFIASRRLYQCAHCRHQVSVTADTLFHATKIPLVKWFWAIYLMGSDKGGISVLRASKQLGVSWNTAHSMLRKIRQAMAYRDSIYRLSNLIEMDDALVGGKRCGKRGRGAEGKRPVLVAVEVRGDKAGFTAMQAVDSICGTNVAAFLHKHLLAGQTVKTDALPALNTTGEQHEHLKQVTPPEEANVWLPMVHIMIGNMKQFINGTFHGVSSRYLQEYLDEFCYRFNRRFWEPQLPLRLLNACLAHIPVRKAEFR